MPAAAVIAFTHTVEDWTACAQTHTDRQTDRQSENIMSASFTPFHWRSHGWHGWARAHPTSARVGREICTNSKSFLEE